MVHFRENLICRSFRDRIKNLSFGHFEEIKFVYNSVRRFRVWYLIETLLLRSQYYTNAIAVLENIFIRANFYCYNRRQMLCVVCNGFGLKRFFARARNGDGFSPVQNPRGERPTKELLKAHCSSECIINSNKTVYKLSKTHVYCWIIIMYMLILHMSLTDL